jgi:hypothetical protein
LSYDELVVLLYIASSSTVLISGKGVLPEEISMESIADEAFVRAGIDMSARIGKDTYASWILDYLGINEEAPSIGLREYLKRMNALKQSKTSGPTAGQVALEQGPAGVPLES